MRYGELAAAYGTSAANHIDVWIKWRAYEDLLWLFHVVNFAIENAQLDGPLEPVLNAVRYNLLKS
jgi:hypothetical protein